VASEKQAQIIRIQNSKKRNADASPAIRQ